MESTDFLYSFSVKSVPKKIIKCISTPLKDSAMRTELSMLNLCRMRPVFTSGDKYSENMQYKDYTFFFLSMDSVVLAKISNAMAATKPIPAK